MAPSPLFFVLTLTDLTDWAGSPNFSFQSTLSVSPSVRPPNCMFSLSWQRRSRPPAVSSHARRGLTCLLISTPIINQTNHTQACADNCLSQNRRAFVYYYNTVSTNCGWYAYESLRIAPRFGFNLHPLPLVPSTHHNSHPSPPHHHHHLSFTFKSYQLVVSNPPNQGSWTVYCQTGGIMQTYYVGALVLVCWGPGRGPMLGTSESRVYVCVAFSSFFGHLLASRLAPEPSA
jgi:hypothetical protein